MKGESAKCLSTWYEIIVARTKAGPVLDTEASGSMHGAQWAVRRFDALYGHAELIYVRQHCRGGRVRVLHDLTVRREGKVAQQ